MLHGRRTLGMLHVGDTCMSVGIGNWGTQGMLHGRRTQDLLHLTRDSAPLTWIIWPCHHL